MIQCVQKHLSELGISKRPKSILVSERILSACPGLSGNALLHKSDARCVNKDHLCKLRKAPVKNYKEDYGEIQRKYGQKIKPCGANTISNYQNLLKK